MHMCVNKRVELAQRGIALYKIYVLLLLFIIILMNLKVIQIYY